MLSAPPAVTLRPYPAPYQAALSLCSDLDGSSPSAFLEIHRFLNTTRATSCGPGVGLDIADSFWLYEAGATPRGFSYFEGVSDRPSRWAPMLRDFVRAGFIDTLHAYGDFSGVGGFERRFAEQGVRRLRDEGLTVPVWTNHGDRQNAQNLGESWSGGDVPGHAAYHWDVTRRLGIEFIWRSTDLTQVWGQQRPLKLRDLLTWERWQHPRTAARTLAHQWRARGASFWQNPLCEPVMLRDGSTAAAFKRYGRFSPHDRAADAGAALSEARLAALVRRQGAALLYTHLGKAPRSGGPVVPVAAQEGLRRLAAYARRGSIWVTTTARLLRYLQVREALSWRVLGTGDWLHLEVTGAAAPEQLAGITFVLDRARPVKVQFGPVEVPLRVHTDERTGQGWAMVPLQPLQAEALASYWEQPT